MTATIDYNYLYGKSLEYEKFLEAFVREVESPNLDDEDEAKHYENRKLNLQRTRRIDKTFEPSEELKNQISEINSAQTWFAITESWCGDSAQNLPHLNKIAKLNSNISLRIILRDDNTEIIDQYLTNGSRSIPKLIAFNQDEKEIFQWGPRPKIAQQLVLKLKADGLDKADLNKELHTWYSKNKGKELEKEISNLIAEKIS